MVRPQVTGMTEYIEREAISEEIRKYYYKNPPNSSYGEGFDRGLDRAQRAIRDAPTADVAPVRHGRWEAMQYEGGILDGTNFDKCSVCGYERIFEDEKLKTAFNYCPNCGTLMDLEKMTNGTMD